MLSNRVPVGIDALSDNTVVARLVGYWKVESVGVCLVVVAVGCMGSTINAKQF